MKTITETEFQKESGEFVRREVFACVSGMAEFILKKDDTEAPFTFEDIENLYYPKTEEENAGEAKEIYEYWIVSNWLIEKLADKGEAIIRHENIWCRTTTGQAILLDSVIREIVTETLQIQTNNQY